MHIYLLIQTLQCEQKHIIHESLLQTYNPPVNQLLLCPEWLWCHFKCHSSLMLENSHIRHSILAVFVLYGMIIRHPGAVYFWLFHFPSITCSVQHIITLTGEERADLYIVVYQWACTLECSHFCVCPFGSRPKVICDSWCLHFIIIIVVL